MRELLNLCSKNVYFIISCNDDVDDSGLHMECWSTYGFNNMLNVCLCLYVKHHRQWRL